MIYQDRETISKKNHHCYEDIKKELDCFNKMMALIKDYLPKHPYSKPSSFKWKRGDNFPTSF